MSLNAAANLVDTTFVGGGHQALGGLYSGAAWLDEAVTRNLLGQEDYTSGARAMAEGEYEEAAQKMASNTAGMPEWYRKVSDLGQSAGAMLMNSMMAGTATAGAAPAMTGAAAAEGTALASTGEKAASALSSLGTKAYNNLLNNAGLYMNSAGAAGQGIYQAYQEGADLDEQGAYGLLSGAAEYASEKLFGGNPLFDQNAGAVNRLVGKVTQNPAVLSALSSAPAELFGEGLEEVITAFADPVWQWMTYKQGEDIDWATFDELADNFLSGVALAGLMQGGQAVVNGVRMLPVAGQQVTTQADMTSLESQLRTAAEQTIEAYERQAGSADTGTKAATESAPHIALEDFTNPASEVYLNVPYEDAGTQRAITKEIADEMIANNEVVQIDTDSVADYYPDLRSVSKPERNRTLKERISALKTDLRQFLKGLTGSTFEFEVNGNLLDARLYNTGIQEVMEKLRQEKSAMLYQSEEIFDKARYLYSTPDYEGNPNIYRWNYFYVPVQIDGGDITGVRIAIRDVANANESQIYNWNIKKETSLAGEGGKTTSIPFGRSSEVSSEGEGSPSLSQSIPHGAENVNRFVPLPIAGQENARAQSETAAQNARNVARKEGGAVETWEHARQRQGPRSEFFENTLRRTVGKETLNQVAADLNTADQVPSDVTWSNRSDSGELFKYTPRTEAEQNAWAQEQIEIAMEDAQRRSPGMTEAEARWEANREMIRQLEDKQGWDAFDVKLAAMVEDYLVDAYRSTKSEIANDFFPEIDDADLTLAKTISDFLRMETRQISGAGATLQAVAERTRSAPEQKILSEVEKLLEQAKEEGNKRLTDDAYMDTLTAAIESAARIKQAQPEGPTALETVQEALSPADLAMLELVQHREGKEAEAQREAILNKLDPETRETYDRALAEENAARRALIDLIQENSARRGDPRRKDWPAGQPFS